MIFSTSFWLEGLFNTFAIKHIIIEIEKIKDTIKIGFGFSTTCIMIVYANFIKSGTN